MSDNIITTGKKTNGEFAITYQDNGYGGCIPVVDGVPHESLMFGYISESDKRACMNLISEAIQATNGNIYEAQRYMMNAVRVAAEGIKPNEVITVNGEEILISYEAKKAYIGTEEIANLDDLQCELPNEAIKVMLADRVRLAFEARETEARIAEAEYRQTVYLRDIDDSYYEDDDDEEEDDDNNESEAKVDYEFNLND